MMDKIKLEKDLSKQFIEDFVKILESFSDKWIDKHVPEEHHEECYNDLQTLLIRATDSRKEYEKVLKIQAKL